MTDESSAVPPMAGEGASQQPGAASIQILAQYVKDLSFENPNASQTLVARPAAPQVSVNVDVRTAQIDETTYEVILTIKGEAKTGELQAFVIELAYGGLVKLTDLAKEQIAAALYVEVPRLLFPFARAVVAEATRNGGYPPLLVQPIDFVALFRRQIEAMRQRQAAAGNDAVSDQPPLQ